MALDLILYVLEPLKNDTFNIGYSAIKYLTTLQEMIQKQEIETEKKVEKDQAANYSKTQTRYSSARSKWTSPISGILSDEALRIEQENQEKFNRLEQRRRHLSTILEAEKTKFENELTSIRQSSRESIPKIKIRADSHRSARESERQTKVDEKLYERSLINKLDLHPIEEPKLEILQPEYWSEQFSERNFVQQQEESDQHLDEHDRQEYEKQNERKRRIEQLKIILQQQMNEIKQKEEESEILKQEEERLLRERWQLNQYEEERKQMEKHYIQQDNGRQLLRQHKAKLHKRAKEIQEQLELDIKILVSIAHADQESHLEQSKQQEQLKQDAFNMLKQVQQQMKFEKEKEQEFDAIFQEEAAKLWSRREPEWNREKELREKLIRQIIDERQEQIMKKLQVLKEQQQEIYDKQRTLIDDMERARKYNLIEKQKQAKEREEKKQISITQQERTKSQLEFEKQDIIEHEYKKQIDPLVQKQKGNITGTTVEPKFFGRRRVNWN